MKKWIFLLLLLSPLFLANPAHSYETGQPWASSTDRRTGVNTSKYKHIDGSYTIIQRDRYGRILRQRHVLSRRSGGTRRNLPYARSTNRYTGVTTTKRKHSDGSYTIIKRDRYGRIIGQRHVLSRRSGGGRVNLPYASSTDRRTGVTTTKRVHSDGSYTIYKRDRYGRILGQRHVLSRRSGGGRVNQPYARSTDRRTGVSTTKTRNSDGSFTVIKRYSNGRIISARRVQG
jgi:hypothetical protein